jgi:hypothetical protein
MKGATMLVGSQPCDPAVHAAAITIARSFVWIIQAILREEERNDALREAFNVAREELEVFQAKEKSK